MAKIPAGGREPDQEVLYPNPGFPIYESQTECKHTASAQPRTAARIDS